MSRKSVNCAARRAARQGKDQPIHADFLRIEQDTNVRVEVPVVFVDHMASNGIKRGAVLNVVRKAVEVTCLAKDIPERFEADLTGLNVNDAVKYSHLLDITGERYPNHPRPGHDYDHYRAFCAQASGDGRGACRPPGGRRGHRRGRIGLRLDYLLRPIRWGIMTGVIFS